MVFVPSHTFFHLSTLQRPPFSVEYVIMKKIHGKEGFYIVILIFVLWAGLSTYWYTCSLKNLCSLNNNEVSKKDYDYKRSERDNFVVEEPPEVQRVVSLKKKVLKQKLTCSPYLKKSIVLGRRNDINEVAKLEKFLNDFEGESLVVDGYYQREDYMAVKRFQEKYSEGDQFGKKIENIDGVVGPETLRKINLLYCIEKGKEYLKTNN